VLVQEYAKGGDLHQVVRKQGGRLPEPHVVQAVLQPLLKVRPRPGAGVWLEAGQAWTGSRVWL
jgi:hypothetical protein